MKIDGNELANPIGSTINYEWEFLSEKDFIKLSRMSAVFKVELNGNNYNMYRINNISCQKVENGYSKVKISFGVVEDK